MAVWAHPLDVHYLCRGLSGWPKLHIQVWSLDKHGRADICERRAGPRSVGCCSAGQAAERRAGVGRRWQPAASLQPAGGEGPGGRPGRADGCSALSAGGYGFCHMPTASGTYELDCPTWLPEVGR